MRGIFARVAQSREVVLTGLVRLLGVGLNFVTTLVLARLYGPEALGIYAMTFAALMLIATPVSRGWGTVLLRESARETYAGSWPRTPVLLARGRQIAAGIVCLAAVLGTFFIHMNDDAGSVERIILIIGGFCATLLANQLSALRMSLARGFGYVSIGQLPENVFRPVALAVIVWLLSGSDLAEDLVLVVVLGFAGAAWLSYFLGEGLLRLLIVRVGYRPEDGEEHFRKWLSASLVISMNGALYVIFSNFGVFWLGTVASLAEVGVFKMATQLAFFAGFAYTTLNIVAAHRFSSLIAKGDVAALTQTGSRFAKIAFAWALPFPILFFLWGGPIVGMVFGEEFVPAIMPAIILCLSELVNAGFGMVAMLLTMSGREAIVIKYTFFALIIQIMLAIPLGALLGATGVAFALVVSASYLNFMYHSKVRAALGADISILGKT